MPRSVPETFVDSAKGNFFVIENSLIDRFGSKLKAPGLAVYAALKRHANSKSGEAYVGVEKIGAKLSLSKRSTYRYLQLLEELKLIRIVRMSERTIYYVLPVPRTASQTPQSDLGPLFEAVPLETLSATTDTQCHQRHDVLPPAAQGCATGGNRYKEEQDLFNKTSLNKTDLNKTGKKEPPPEPTPDSVAEIKRLRTVVIPRFQKEIIELEEDRRAEIARGGDGSKTDRLLEEARTVIQNSKAEAEALESATPDLPAGALARGLLERIHLPITPTNITAASAAITAVQLQRGNATAQDSCDWLEWKAVAAQEAGAKVNKFWFEDGSYNANGGRNGNANDRLKNRIDRELEINDAR